MKQDRGFFPLFLDVRRKNILFVGGGRIAERRIGVMSKFQCQIQVVSPEVTEEIQKLAEAGIVVWRKQPFEESCLDCADIVLICTDHPDLNHEIWGKCRERRILANNCSNHEECDFYFPGIVVKDEITVGVNAGGKAHKKAASLRKAIGALLEESVNEEETGHR